MIDKLKRIMHAFSSKQFFLILLLSAILLPTIGCIDPPVVPPPPVHNWIGETSVSCDLCGCVTCTWQRCTICGAKTNLNCY